jgi:Peptidase propeptide and YPEB domain
VKYNPILLAFLASMGGAALGAGGVFFALDRTAPPAAVAPAATPAAEPTAPAPAPPPAPRDPAPASPPASSPPASAAASPPAPVPAPSQQGDAQRALEGVRKQEFLSLQALSEKVRARIPGEVVSAALSEDDGVLHYELKLLTADGRILEIAADPRTGAVLDIEEDDD